MTRVALHQYQHEAINRVQYPGTRQLCIECKLSTDRCEEDSLITEDGIGPLCEECYRSKVE